jgi:hypothetical protein
LGIKLRIGYRYDRNIWDSERKERKGEERRVLEGDSLIKENLND